MARKAPDFTLLDQSGDAHSLKDYRGRWVVAYFYPHDHALGCTKEACDFRREYQAIEQFGNAIVIGINHGSVKSHRNFASMHRLNFPILSDAGHQVSAAFGAWKTGQAKGADKLFSTRRNTYLINPKGYIVKEYRNVRPAGHVEQIISDLQDLQASLVK